MEYEKQFASPLDEKIKLNELQSAKVLVGSYVKTAYEESMKNNHLKSTKVEDKKWNVA